MMSNTLQNGKHKTEVFIDFDNEDFACYYDASRDRCYYDINGELLLIIDPQKIQKIKKEYERKRNLKYAGIGLAIFASGFAVYILAKYIQNRKESYGGLIQEF